MNCPPDLIRLRTVNCISVRARPLLLWRVSKELENQILSESGCGSFAEHSVRYTRIPATATYKKPRLRRVDIARRLHYIRHCQDTGWKNALADILLTNSTPLKTNSLTKSRDISSCLTVYIRHSIPSNHLLYKDSHKRLFIQKYSQWQYTWPPVT
jgi:hypothetical protein